jgi:two-component system, cell cycle sensor histidine kinase and response regulator CckA
MPATYRELNQADERYYKLLETLPLIVYSVEPRPPYAPQYVSRGIEILGYTREEWLAVPDRWMESIHADDRDRVLAASEEAFVTGGSLDYEYRLVARDGAIVWVHDRGSFVCDDGDEAQWRGIMIDVTARKQAELALAEAEGKLRHAQRLDVVGRLAGGIAHDFNNILTIITSHAGFVMEALELEGELYPEARKDLLVEMREIRGAAMRAADLTRQLLAFGRGQVLQPRVLDLNRIVEDAARMMRRVIPENVVMTTLPAPTSLLVMADGGQLEQVLTNLIVNARDAMPNGGTLMIRVQSVETKAGLDCAGEHTRAGRYARVSVADTGTGMNDETLARAFEPFFTTKPFGQGTGLGLSTAHGIIKQSSGFISLDSAPGRGTSVHVHLPMLENQT